jgi:hypothetical protein
MLPGRLPGRPDGIYCTAVAVGAGCHHHTSTPYLRSVHSLSLRSTAKQVAFYVTKRYHPAWRRVSSWEAWRTGAACRCTETGAGGITSQAVHLESAHQVAAQRTCIISLYSACSARELDLALRRLEFVDAGIRWCCTWPGTSEPPRSTAGGFGRCGLLEVTILTIGHKFSGHQAYLPL